MALDNLRCPQFVDFTNVATFSIDDGADIYFEKGVVGELGLGFNDQNTDNDGIDDLISALNDATIHKTQQNPHDKKDSGISECLNTSPQNGNKENNNPKATTTTTNKKQPKTTTTTTTTVQNHYRKRTTSAGSTTSNGSVNNTNNNSNISTTSKYAKHNSSTQQQQQQNIVKKTIAKVTAAFKSTSSKQQSNDLKLKSKQQTTSSNNNRKKTCENHGPLKVEHNAVMITVATQQHHHPTSSSSNDPSQQMVSLEIVQTSTSTRRCSSVPRTLKEKQAVTTTQSNTRTLGEKIQNFFSRDSNKNSKTSKCEPRHRSRSNNKQTITENDEHDDHKAKERCSRVQTVATTAVPVVKQQTKALNNSQVNRNNTLTEPKSPNFSKPRQRSCDRKDMLPYQGVKFIPKVAHKYTAIEPFSSLEERNKQAAARKEEKMKKLLQENEMNKYNNSHIPCYKPLAVNRLNSSLNKTNNKENTDTSEQQQQQHIKQQNLTINDNQLFNQHKSAANLSTISNSSGTMNTSKCKQQASMLLHTEARAQKRQQYDQYLKDKERMAELIKKNLEMQKMMQDKNEIQKLRAQLLFKSKPYNKTCKPMEIRPSEKPLTEPKSPKFLSTTSNSKLNGSSNGGGLVRSLSQEDLSSRIKASDN